MNAEAGGRSVDIPPEVAEAIERQRRRLQRASTLLTCLWIGTLCQEWHHVQIDAADVALVMRGMIGEAINRLDLVELARERQESDGEARMKMFQRARTRGERKRAV